MLALQLQKFIFSDTGFIIPDHVVHIGPVPQFIIPFLNLVLAFPLHQNFVFCFKLINIIDQIQFFNILARGQL